MFSHDDDDIVSDCCSFFKCIIFATLAAFEKAEGSEGKEQKLVDENYISMTEINF